MQKLKNKKTWITVLGVIILLNILEEINEHIASFVFIIIIGWLIYKWLTNRQTKKNIPGLTKEKQEHYHEAGMSDKEIAFFRQTLGETKEQINQLEVNINQVAKLKAINLRYDTLKVTKAMFKELVKEPRKLHLADKFLYNHLPNLVELTNKYVEISDHEIKSKSTYEALNESVVAIEAVSELIIEDYANFVADDIEDLEVEISIAKQNTQREQDKKNLSENQEEL